MKLHEPGNRALPWDVELVRSARADQQRMEQKKYAQRHPPAPKPPRS